MSGKAARIQLTELMYDILTELARRRGTSVAISLRAKIILMAFERNTNQEIAVRLGQCSKTVGQWRRRFRDSWPALLRMQFEDRVGGGVAAPVLPHHRAYGSVHGGSVCSLQALLRF